MFMLNILNPSIPQQIYALVLKTSQNKTPFNAVLLAHAMRGSKHNFLSLFFFFVIFVFQYSNPGCDIEQSQAADKFQAHISNSPG